eukprot:6459555-Amphidinium_carterae.1
MILESGWFLSEQCLELLHRTLGSSKLDSSMDMERQAPDAHVTAADLYGAYAKSKLGGTSGDLPRGRQQQASRMRRVLHPNCRSRIGTTVMRDAGILIRG